MESKVFNIKMIPWIIVKYLSLVFFSFAAVLPVVSCVITAFKTEEEYQTTNVMTLPQNWLNFDNFIQAFTKAGMGRAFVNSLIILACVLPHGKKKNKEEVRNVVLTETLLIPDGPELQRDYNISRETKEKWSDEQADLWFEVPTEKDINSLEKANDNIISEITGAAP